MTELKNIEIEKRERVYAGWLNVDIAYMKLPDGSIMPREVVQRNHWVAVVAVTDDNQIIMTKQPRAGIARFSLEVIAGHIEEKHHGNAKLAAMDELRQEAGVDPNTCEWIDLGVFVPDPAYCTCIGHVFLAKHAKPTMELELEEGEKQLETVLIPYVEALNIVKDGFDTRIWDANSTVSILRAEKHIL